jgi:hypothetical protein
MQMKMASLLTTWLLSLLIFDNNLNLEIVCKQKEITRSEDLNVILKLRNNTQNEIVIPSAFDIQPKANFSNIYFEIVSLKDGRKVTDQPSPDVQKRLSMEMNRKLKPGEEVLIETKFHHWKYYFNEQGKYKIRFTFRASNFNERFEDVSTGWYNINVHHSFIK